MMLRLYFFGTADVQWKGNFDSFGTTENAKLFLFLVIIVLRNVEGFVSIVNFKFG